MIHEVHFKQSILDGVKFLKQIGLHKGIGIKKLGDHSDEFKKISRKNRHTEIYSTAIANRDYEILLNDDSMFQFGIDDETLRYAFIQNPSIIVSKEEFLAHLYSNEDLMFFTPKELEELKATISENDYEQFLNEQDLNLESHIIRYDLDLKGYDPLVHSYSHIHIGLNENLRIPVSKVLTPLNFIFFAIKHTYYKDWKKSVQSSQLKEQLKKSKRSCIDLPKAHWHEDEKLELYLS